MFYQKWSICNPLMYICFNFNESSFFVLVKKKKNCFEIIEKKNLETHITYNYLSYDCALLFLYNSQ